MSRENGQIRAIRLVPVAVPVGSLRTVENGPTQAKNMPAKSIENH